MTTAQRARELAEYFSGYGELNVAGETSAALTELSRMLEAALPDTIEAIANRHAGQDAFIRGGSRGHMVQEHIDRGVLLDAVRVLAADQQRATEIIDERIAETEKWHAHWKHVKAEQVADRLEIERLQNQSDAARAEVERVKAEAEARNKERRSIFCVHCNETYLTYTPEEATANPRLLAGVLDWSLRHDAECVANPIGIRLRDAEKRADMLAEGLRMMLPIIEAFFPQKTWPETLQKLTNDNGHLVSRE